jgi:hypothetical protein
LTDHPALSVTLTDVEKVLDSKDMKVKPKTLEQIANDTIIFYKNPGPLGDTQFKLLKNAALTVGGLRDELPEPRSNEVRVKILAAGVSFAGW